MNTGTAPRTLLLLRHAQASTASAIAGVGDHGRDLDATGEAEAVARGAQLRRQGLLPELALVSSALRTRQTWALLDLPESVSMHVADRLYLAEPDDLLAAARAVPENVLTLLLLAHNPGLHQLALHLSGGTPPAAMRVPLPTCGLVRLAVRCPWSALAPDGVAAVDRL